jgi:hypothetical protein
MVMKKLKQSSSINKEVGRFNQLGQPPVFLTAYVLKLKRRRFTF